MKLRPFHTISKLDRKIFSTDYKTLVFVDGAFDPYKRTKNEECEEESEEKPEQLGIGVMVRSGEGTLLDYFSKTFYGYKNVSNPKKLIHVSELLALRAGTDFLLSNREKFRPPYIIFTDSQSSVESLEKLQQGNAKYQPKEPFKSLYREIIDNLNSLPKETQICWITSEINLGSHHLAVSGRTKDVDPLDHKKALFKFHRSVIEDLYLYAKPLSYYEELNEGFKPLSDVNAPVQCAANALVLYEHHQTALVPYKHQESALDGIGEYGTMGMQLLPDGIVHLDCNDRNYDSEEEPYKLVEATFNDPLDDYKKAVVSIIEEYFCNGAVEVATSDLNQLSSSEYHPYFVKRLVSMAMDRHDKEKEMASVLLSALYADVISPAHISQGFILLLESADDLSVDIPDVVKVLALFIARAVFDDILPPAFITRVEKNLPLSSKGLQAVQIADKSYLSAPHHAELVEHKWGGCTHLPVEEVKNKISRLLREYVETGDALEACSRIRELGVAFFHHEVVKKALVLAMEIRSAEPLIMKLLRNTSEEGLISTSQMVKGFYRVEESLEGISLDIPSARTLFQSLVRRAISEGWLDASFSKSYVEESDFPEDGGTATAS